MDGSGEVLCMIMFSLTTNIFLDCQISGKITKEPYFTGTKYFDFRIHIKVLDMISQKGL